MSLETFITAGIWAIWATYANDIKEEVIKKLGDKASKKAKEVAEAAWDRVDWKISSNKYRQKLQQIYGTTRILGKAEPVSLEGIFTDVYILNTPSALYRYDIQRLHADPAHLDKRPRKNGTSLVKGRSSRRIFVLGKPGSGKTTFLKYLTIQAAKGVIDKIPIFVSLKEWADSGLSLSDFIVKQFDICDFPDASVFVEHILKKGNTMVLFDGLDEVSQEGNQRARMINDLRDFSNKYYEESANTQCLITCRIAATEYTFAHFTYVEIADFSDEQVRTFARKWFKGARRKHTLFKEAFYRADNKSVQELARTPLLLSLLCLSFDASLDIPHRRAEIYEEAVEALLKKWDATRSIRRDEIYRGLSLGRKRQMFARIAAQTFQDGEYFIFQQHLSKLIVDYIRRLPGVEESDEIDGDAILKAIEAQHGIFTERAYRIYSFSHLTIQEYFTAKHIIADTSGKALRGLLTIEHITDDRWREVIILTASLLDNADEFFKIFTSALDDLASNTPLALQLLHWVKQRVGDSENAPALRAYYCYLILSLIFIPTLGEADKGMSMTPLSFSRRYPPTLIIRICFSVAQRLDRSNKLSEYIAKDTLYNIEMGRRALQSGEHASIAPIPTKILNVQNDLAPCLSSAFFFALTITNLRESFNTIALEDKLRSYVDELRKYVISVSNAEREHPTGARLGNLSADAILRDLDVPTESASSTAWVTLVVKLHALIMGEVNHGVSYTEDLASFFLAMRLMLDCLALSIVSDRAAIESNLLVPPC